MAQLVKKPSLLRLRYGRLRRKRTACFGLACALLLASPILAAMLAQPMLLLLVPVALLCIWAGHRCDQHSHILASGLQGEEQAAKLLQQLPQSYRCYQNVLLRRGGRTWELDFLVTGPAGLFVVEVKNQRGRIRGDGDGEFWLQEKTGRGGGQYSKQLKNPVRQVGGHMSILTGWLNSRGWTAPVSGAVYFTDPQTTVQAQKLPRGISVFAAGQGQALLERIRSREGQLSRQLLLQLDQALKEL